MDLGEQAALIELADGLFSRSNRYLCRWGARPRNLICYPRAGQPVRSGRLSRGGRTGPVRAFTTIERIHDRSNGART